MSTLPPPVPAGNVFPIMKQWFFQRASTGYTGTKVFVDDSAAPAGSTAGVPLPDIGDSWDGTYWGVTCKQIRATYMGDSPTCPRQYECYYDSTLVDVSVSGGSGSWLPVSMQIGGNFRTFGNPVGKTGEWFWTDAGTSCGTSFNSPIPEMTKTIAVQRYVYGSDLDQWSKLTDKCVGTVNDADFWPASQGTILIGGGSTATFAFKKEQLLYLGADLVENTNSSDSRRWECTLKFEASFKTNDDGVTWLGWNYEWNSETNKWDKPKCTGNGNKTLYRSTDFKLLFSTGQATFIPNSAFPFL